MGGGFFMEELKIFGVLIGNYGKRQKGIITDSGDIILTFDKFKPNENISCYAVSHKESEEIDCIIQANMQNKFLVAEIIIKNNFSLVCFSLYDRNTKRYLFRCNLMYRSDTLNFYWE